MWWKCDTNVEREVVSALDIFGGTLVNFEELVARNFQA